MTWDGDLNATPLADDMPPDEINRVMIATRRIAWAKVNELRDLAVKKSEAKRAAKTAYARALLSSEGPVEIRKAHATLAAAEAQFQYDVAEEMVTACREALDAVHDDFEAVRSINADYRAERSGRAPS